MKQASLILNIVLTIAVAFLLYQHFTNKETSTAIISSSDNNGIVFVNSDSLLSNYEYYKDLEVLFSKKRDAIQSKLAQRESAFEKEVNDYQQKAPNMSPQERAVVEERLYAKTENIKQQRQQLVDDFSKEEAIYNDSLYNRLQNFMKEYNKTKGYKYILGHQRGGGILFASDSLEITSDLIKSLNEAYASEKK